MNKVKIGLLTFGLAAASVVQAQLPTEATNALTAIGTGVSDTESAVWPIIGAALVAGIVIKLVKRFANKI
jgi:hypothetical protein